MEIHEVKPSRISDQRSKTRISNRLQKDSSELSAVEKLWRWQCIVRKGDFDPYEVAVLSEVWDKSTAWGKEWAYLALSELATRRRMSRRKVVSTLASLVERGILTKCHTEIKNGYKVNYGEVEAMALGQKGGAATQKRGSELVHEVHSASAPGAPKKKKKEQSYQEPRCGPAVRDKNDGDKLEAYRTRHWDRKGSEYLQTTWVSAWRRSGYGQATIPPGWGKKERGQAGHLLKYFPGGVREFHAFLEWLVVDWPRIITEMGIRRAPKLPSIGFILVVRKRFFDSWQTMELDAFKSDLDVERIARFRARGMSEQQAVAADERIDEVDRRDAERRSARKRGDLPPAKPRDTSMMHEFKKDRRRFPR